MARRSRRAPEQPAAAASGSRDRPRTRPARRREEGLLERYRTLIITGLGVTGLLIVGVFIFQGGARAAYECASLLTPAPAETVTPRPPTPSPELTPSPEPTQTPGSAQTPAAGTPDPDATPSPEPTQTPEPTPEPEPTPRLGFPTADMGRRHVRDPGQTLRYSFCPPTSGDHFAITGRGPIRGDVYPPQTESNPGGWVHNLEHGWVVLAYRCPSGEAGTGDCPTAAELAELERWFHEAPDSGIAACPRKVLVARFDDMDTRFAVLAWDRALLMDEFDLDNAITFAEQWMDHAAAPEAGIC